MSWKVTTGCVATAAGLAGIAEALSTAQRFQSFVSPLFAVALVIVIIGGAIFLGGLLLSAFWFLRGVHVSPKRKPKPRPARQPVGPAPGNSGQIRTLQGLIERGRTIQMQIPSGAFAFIRPAAEQAESWYGDVQLALDPTQRDHLIQVAGQFRTGSSSELVGSMWPQIRALEEMVNSMCVVLKPAKEFHGAN